MEFIIFGLTYAMLVITFSGKLKEWYMAYYNRKMDFLYACAATDNKPFLVRVLGRNYYRPEPLLCQDLYFDMLRLKPDVEKSFHFNNLLHALITGGGSIIVGVLDIWIV